MAAFGLVHGAWHGEWCWELLQPELESLGHRVVTVELPSDDPGATFTTYAETVVDAVAAEGDDLVLVAHSLAGLSVPIAAAELPARRLVFLCALLASPGRSFVGQLETETDMLLPRYLNGLGKPDEQGRREWVDFDVARDVLFNDCDDELARRAFDRLRPQALAPYIEPCPLEALPDVDYGYVVCSDDGIVNPEWGARAARERLGVEPVELPGSHSPFLSRPEALAATLAGMV